MANKNKLPISTYGRENIGGAIITRSFTLPASAPEDVRQSGDRTRAKVGAFLSEVCLRAMKNRRALEDNGYLKVAARAPGMAADNSGEVALLKSQLAEMREQLEASGGARYRYAYHTGMGKYDVIDGLRLNTSSLTKEEAAEMTKGFEPPELKAKN